MRFSIAYDLGPVKYTRKRALTSVYTACKMNANIAYIRNTLVKSRRDREITVNAVSLEEVSRLPPSQILRTYIYIYVVTLGLCRRQRSSATFIVSSSPAIDLFVGKNDFFAVAISFSLR